MHYRDLTEYRYTLPQPLPHVFNVGWLGKDEPYDVGAVPAQTMARLTDLIATQKTNLMRGFHLCELCVQTGPFFIEVGDRRIYRIEPHVIDVGNECIQLGSAEVWVPSGNTVVYAAPNLIHHYITTHNYRPPQEFLDAIDAFPRDAAWDADREYDKRVRALYANRS